MRINTTGLITPPEPENDRHKHITTRSSITEMAAVDELCSILARILMRVQSDQAAGETPEGGEP